MSIRLPELLACLATATGALRYRFFLVAGIFPYLLGAAVAYRTGAPTDWWLLSVGLAGVLAISAGIEGLNEYFDKLIGTDRVFELGPSADGQLKTVAGLAEAGPGSATPATTLKFLNVELAQHPKAHWPLPVGLAGFGVALLIGIYLTCLRGWPILALMLFGGAAALSYLCPGVHLSYRGLGETVITLSYGCGLTLGGYYLQAGRLSWSCVWASLLPALLILAMTLANEVPDYHGDRLVGKRNIVVRIGQRGAARLYGIVTASCFILLLIGLLAGIYPPLLGWAFLLAPLAFANGLAALRLYDAPAQFCRVIRGAMLQYVLVTLLAAISYVWGA
ncbi:MAG: prenyltransferase [Lentisphaerae bacterium]|nr:prenyltransferase [Lentisphaerota bacterium]